MRTLGFVGKFATLAVAMAVAVGAETARAEATATSTLSAKAYVQKGLALQYDAIENAGYGQHDNAATSWKDLVGDNDIPTRSGDTWSANSISLVKGVRSTTNAVFPGYTQVTFDFNGRPLELTGSNEKPIINIPYICMFGWDTRNNGGIAMTRPNPTTDSTGTKTHVQTYYCGYGTTAELINAGKCRTYATVPTCGTTASAKDPVYINGQSVNSTTTCNWGNNNRNGSLLLSVGHVDARSELRAIRIYNRALNASEVYINANVDKIRFDGEDGAALTWPDGFYWQDGTVKVRIAVGMLDSTKGEVSMAFDGGAEVTGVATNHYDINTVADTVTYKVMPAAGETFAYWASDFDVLTSDQLTNTTLTFTTKLPHSLTAVFDGDVIPPAARKWTGIAGDGCWDNPLNWFPAGVPVAGDDLTIPSGATQSITNSTVRFKSITVAGTLVFSNWESCVNADKVTIAKGGVATSVGPFKTDADKSRVYFNCGELTVESGGKINVSEQGWSCGDSSNNMGYGPGVLASTYSGRIGGGSHGGIGSFSLCSQRSYTANPTQAAMDALTYGSASAPETAGSGGYSTAGTGGHGGGVVRIAATGRVTINGQILANGKTTRSEGGGGSRYDGAGAGGSIYITCETFAGTNGLIRARGGESNTQTSRCFHGGGGGRVAIIFDTAKQALLEAPKNVEFSADCGPYHPDGLLGFSQARPGTLYFSSDALIDRTGCSLFGALDFANVTDTWTIDSFRMTNGWATLARDSVEMRVTGDFEITGKTQYNRRMSGTSACSADTNGTRWDVGGTKVYMVTNLISILQGSYDAPRLTVGGDMKINDNGIVQVWSSDCLLYPDDSDVVKTNVGARVSVGGQLKLSATGKIYCRCHLANGTYPYISANSLDVDSTSFINSNTEGYAGFSNNADNIKPVPVPNVPVSSMYGSWWEGTTGRNALGASHGGEGGYSRGQIIPVMMPAYDNPQNPVLPGGGGMGWFNSWFGARGGGVVCLSVAQAAKLDGTLTANGAGADYTSGSAGGTVRLKCNAISGSGKITANGGTGNTTSNSVGGGGGGGCIWIGYDSTAQSGVDCQIVCTAVGGTTKESSGNGYGYPGTIYFTDQQLIDDLSTWKHVGTIYAPNRVDDFEFNHDLTIDNGFLRLEDGGSLKVNGNLTINGSNRQLYGVSTTNGTLTCTGDLTLKTARVNLGNGYANNSERFKVGGKVVVNNGDLEVDYHPEDLNAKIDFPNGLVLTNTAVFKTTSPRHPTAGGSGLTVSAPNVFIGQNCWIKPYTCPTNGASVLFKVEEKLICSTNGGINASGAGIVRYTATSELYGYDDEPLDGRALAFNDYFGSMPSAGHGGKGGHAVEPGVKYRGTVYLRGRGQPYDNEYKPILAGLPGCGSRWSAPIYAGGGIIRVKTRKLYLNGGTLAANGAGEGFFSHSSYAHRGGGSGGSIYIEALEFYGGSGTISAQGGKGSSYYGFSTDWTAASGGGGRIAMWTTWGDTNATFNVAGGAVVGASDPMTDTQRGYAGEAGTAHWCYLKPPPTMILIK